MKFRVWNDKEKKFEDPERYYIDSFGKLYYREPMDDTVQPANLHLIHQYSTKTTDVSGVEIYEGDIVSYTCWDNECEYTEYNRIKSVDFYEGAFFPREMIFVCDDPFYSWGIKDIQIIGNIFEYKGHIDYGKRTHC